LPDLGDNIKCGNSLIGPDFYQQQQMPLLGEEERYRINVFDWHAEFPQIFRRTTVPGEFRETAAASPLDYTLPGVPLHGTYSYRKKKGAVPAPSPPPLESEWGGGFDAVIGNPPYVRQESLSDLKAYFERHYEAFDGVADLFAYFMEKAAKLLAPGGHFSFIVSSSFLRTTYAEPLRRVLKRNAAVLRIVDFGGLPVFANAKDTYVCIPLLAKTPQPYRLEVSRVDSLAIRDLGRHVTAHHFTIPHDRLSPAAWALKSDEEAAVFAKVMQMGKPLGTYLEGAMFYGLKTGFNEAFEISEQQRAAILKVSPESAALIKPFLGGQDIRRYVIEDNGRHLIVIPSGWTQQQMTRVKNGAGDYSEREAWNCLSREHPAIADHLKNFAESLRKRQDQGDYWWELRPCDYYEYFDSPKIIFPDICKAPRFYLDRTGIYIANTAYCLGTGDPYLLGILNSRLFWFAISNISIPFGIRAGKYRYRLIYQYMEKVPIRPIDADNPADKSRRDQMVQLAEQMLTLHQRLSTAKTPQEKTALERQITATGTQLDRLVYDLYGLTGDEIKMVEGAAP